MKTFLALLLFSEMRNKKLRLVSTTHPLWIVVADGCGAVPKLNINWERNNTIGLYRAHSTDGYFVLYNLTKDDRGLGILSLLERRKSQRRRRSTAFRAVVDITGISRDLYVTFSQTTQPSA